MLAKLNKIWPKRKKFHLLFIVALKKKNSKFFIIISDYITIFQSFKIFWREKGEW